MEKCRFVFCVEWGVVTEASYEEDAGAAYILAEDIFQALEMFAQLDEEHAKEVTAVAKVVENPVNWKV